MKKVYIFFLIIGYLNASSDLYKKNEVVIDKKNNLVWQDTKTNIILQLSQEDANKYCESLKFSRLNDWRLPSVDEYKTIIDKTRKVENKIKKVFVYNSPEKYWTRDRTWLRNFGRYGYFIFFKSGTAYYQNRSYKKLVRCVHSL